MTSRATMPPLPSHLSPVLKAEMRKMMCFCNALVDFNYSVMQDYEHIRRTPVLQQAVSSKTRELLEYSRQIMASLTDTKERMESDHHYTTNRLVMAIVRKAYEARINGKQLDDRVIQMFQRHEIAYKLNHGHIKNMMAIQLDNLCSIEQIVPYFVQSYNFQLPPQSVTEEMERTCSRLIRFGHRRSNSL